MPWTTPETFTAGQTLTAASMNKITENTSVLRVGPSNIVTTTKTDTATYSLATGTDTGDIMTATITPSATTSRVLILYAVTVSCEVQVASRLFRGSTQIALGDAASTRSRVTSTVSDAASIGTFYGMFIDSPATTAATTYAVRLRHGSALTRTLNVNSAWDTADNQANFRAISTLTVMEVAA